MSQGSADNKPATATELPPILSEGRSSRLSLDREGNLRTIEPQNQTEEILLMIYDELLLHRELLAEMFKKTTSENV